MSEVTYKSINPKTAVEFTELYKKMNMIPGGVLEKHILEKADDIIRIAKECEESDLFKNAIKYSYHKELVEAIKKHGETPEKRLTMAWNYLAEMLQDVLTDKTDKETLHERFLVVTIQTLPALVIMINERRKELEVVNA